MWLWHCSYPAISLPVLSLCMNLALYFVFKRFNLCSGSLCFHLAMQKDPGDMNALKSTAPPTPQSPQPFQQLEVLTVMLNTNFKKCVSFTKLLFLSKVHSAELFFFNSCPFSFPSLIKKKKKLEIRYFLTRLKLLSASVCIALKLASAPSTDPKYSYRGLPVLSLQLFVGLSVGFETTKDSSAVSAMVFGTCLLLET